MSFQEDAFRYAIKNAFLHDGKADIGAVVGKVKALHPEIDLKKSMPEIMIEVKKVNAMAFAEISKKYAEFESGYELKIPEKKEGLPELEWASNEEVITRYAPNPNGPFHLGNARAAIISHEYARKYNGKFILRFDDTDPKVKRPMENAEQIFKEDLNWLGIKVDETYFASDRIELYHEFMKKVLDLEKAYVCTCESETWRKLIEEKKPCPCRDAGRKENLERFEKMIKHEFKEGQAVLRIKTDLDNPDPSIRDWWAAKIVDEPEHPRVGSKFHLWPSYNFASAIDDHLLGTTLIIRGQEHAQNMTKQKYLYDYLGWTYPHAIHFGRIRLGDMVLSTSKIAAGIEQGIYSGWDDPRLGTIRALRRKGFQKEPLIKAIIDLGTNTNDATIEISKLVAFNKELIDDKAKRITFLENPVALEVMYCKEDEIEKYGQHYLLKPTERFLVEGKELKQVKRGEIFRLRNALNARLIDDNPMNPLAEFVSFANLDKKLVSWVLDTVDAEIILDDNSLKLGIVDNVNAEIGDYLYLNMFGYCKVESIEDGKIKMIFTHK